MPKLMGRPPSLEPAERELLAFSCVDAEGTLYWVRVFESSITRRTLHGVSVFATGRRYETPNGWPVHPVHDGLYLLFCEYSREWIELEAFDRKRG